MTYTQEKRITQKTVKDMGFTDKLIAELLPEPQLVNNPHYRKAAKMKLWKLSDVENAMNNPAFQESLKKRKKYKEAAEKGVVTKKAHLKDETDKFLESIKIEHLDIGLIREYALKAKQNWCQQLMGLSLKNCAICVKNQKGKTIYKRTFYS